MTKQQQYIYSLPLSLSRPHSPHPLGHRRALGRTPVLYSSFLLYDHGQGDLLQVCKAGSAFLCQLVHKLLQQAKEENIWSYQMQKNHLTKIPQPFTDKKTFSRLEIEGHQLDKEHSQKPMQLIVNDDKLYAFLLKIGNKAGYLPSHSVQYCYWKS